MNCHIYVDKNGYWHIEYDENTTKIPPHISAILFDKMLDEQFWGEILFRLDSWSMQEIYDAFSCSREEILASKDVITERLRSLTSFDISGDDVCEAIASCV